MENYFNSSLKLRIYKSLSLTPFWLEFSISFIIKGLVRYVKF